MTEFLDGKLQNEAADCTGYDMLFIVTDRTADAKRICLFPPLRHEDCAEEIQSSHSTEAAPPPSGGHAETRKTPRAGDIPRARGSVLSSRFEPVQLAVVLT